MSQSIVWTLIGMGIGAVCTLVLTYAIPWREKNLKSIIENSPVILLYIGIAAFASFILNAVALFNIISPHNYYGAREIANEYYLRILETNEKKSAKKLFDKLVKLSEVCKSIDHEFGEGEEKVFEDNDCESKLFKVYREDIILAKSDVDRDKWIVGLDVASKKGTYEKLFKREICYPFRLDLSLKMKCEENNTECKEYLSVLNKIKNTPNLKWKASYFSISSYASTHNVDLTNIAVVEGDDKKYIDVLIKEFRKINNVLRRHYETVP